MLGFIGKDLSLLLDWILVKLLNSEKYRIQLDNFSGEILQDQNATDGFVMKIQVTSKKRNYVLSFFYIGQSWYLITETSYVGEQQLPIKGKEVSHCIKHAHNLLKHHLEE